VVLRCFSGEAASHRSRCEPMRILYSIFATGAKDAAAILHNIEHEQSACVGSADLNRCIVAIHHDTSAAVWRVDLMASEYTQEIVADCWETLISVHVALPREVWLGTYGAETVMRVAQVRPRTIAGLSGYVLRPDELDALLELPVF